MNLFDDSILKSTFNSICKSYILNEPYFDNSKIRGLVTNRELTGNQQFHFHSLDKFERGDVVKINDAQYLTITDVVNSRISKYKAIVEYCNWTYDVFKTIRHIIGYDDIGRPIWKEEEVFDHTEYGILKFQNVQITENEPINLIENVYYLRIRDTDDNRELFNIDDTFDIGDLTLRIVNREFSERGLIILRIEL